MDPHAPASLFVAEPPLPYRVTPPLVIDASVVGALLFREPERDAALAWMQGKQLYAPQLLGYEIANIAASKVRKGFDAEAAKLALTLYESTDIQLVDADSCALLALAQRYRLSAYDAAYLWLAAELKAPLATFDRRLGEAAREHLSKLE